ARSGHGRVARYAWGQDYHRVVKDRLHVLCDELRADHPGELFRAFADTAPVMERDFAAAAGIGWIGKNTLIINPRLGSWLVLGGFLTTMAIEPPPAQGVVPDHCGTCTRCIDACPTGAITPYSVDARRCISYLTIERRSDVDPLLSPGVGDWVFGCDVCQEVCPHNSPRGEGFETGVPRREYSSRTPTLDLSEVLSWTMGDRSRVLGGSAIKRATLAMLKRNAIIAMGNGCRSGERAAVAERLASIARDEGEDVMVRRQAERTLSQWAGEPESPGRGGGGRLS
ncbi:MAG TPA: tRNA epoxyqueuosine(34) reductase QueG, partial [Phycisphaerales bacterium]|nr:tRNA epoxyqueuosine(34) reductase QueG [Phycisphaerales bacterium]